MDELPETIEGVYTLAASIVVGEAQDGQFADMYDRLIAPLRVAAEEYRGAPAQIRDLVRRLFTTDIVKQLVSCDHHHHHHHHLTVD